MASMCDVSISMTHTTRFLDWITLAFVQVISMTTWGTGLSFTGL